MTIEGMTIHDLNPTQRRILLEMEKRDRLAVLGGAGTGKTFIALLRFFMRYKKRKTVRLLFITKT